MFPYECTDARKGLGDFSKWKMCIHEPWWVSYHGYEEQTALCILHSHYNGLKSVAYKLKCIYREWNYKQKIYQAQNTLWSKYLLDTSSGCSEEVGINFPHPSQVPPRWAAPLEMLLSRAALMQCLHEQVWFLSFDMLLCVYHSVCLW